MQPKYPASNRQNKGNQEGKLLWAKQKNLVQDDQIRAQIFVYNFSKQIYDMFCYLFVKIFLKSCFVIEELLIL